MLKRRQKSLSRLFVILAVLLLAAQAFGEYIVVMKDGTRYKAKAKYTVQNGRALILLVNGQSLQVDANLIDAAKSEQLTKLGVNANLVDLTTKMPAAQAPAQPETPLGGQIRLRQRNSKTAAPAASALPTVAPPLPTVAGSVPQRVLDNFDKSYENIGVYEKKITSTGARSLRAELTVDTEERVFNAISATSYLIMRNAGVDGVQIDMVELFMKTTSGGSAGRFQMSRNDADSLEKRLVTQHDYFVRKVIY